MNVRKTIFVVVALGCLVGTHFLQGTLNHDREADSEV
jgi:hypothetical protein